MDRPCGAVYRALEIPTNRSFVAQTTVGLSYEIRQHYIKAQELRTSGVSGGEPFHWLILRHGIDYFKWEILEECYSQWELDNAERRARDFYSVNGGLLNTNRIYGMFGLHHSPETILKFRLARRNRGPMCPETRKKISDTKKGVPLSAKHKANIRLAIIAGMTDERRLRMSQGRMGIVFSETHRKNLARAKLRNTNAAGQYWSEERRAALGARISEYWARRRLEKAMDSEKQKA